MSFASDSTESTDPADYPPFAMQPSIQFPTVTTTEELKEAIVAYGKSVVADQEHREHLASGKIDGAMCRELVDLGTFEIELDD